MKATELCEVALLIAILCKKTTMHLSGEPIEPNGKPLLSFAFFELAEDPLKSATSDCDYRVGSEQSKEKARVFLNYLGSAS